jgi:hypothetical protein
MTQETLGGRCWIFGAGGQVLEVEEQVKQDKHEEEYWKQSVCDCRDSTRAWEMIDLRQERESGKSAGLRMTPVRRGHGHLYLCPCPWKAPVPVPHACQQKCLSMPQPARGLARGGCLVLTLLRQTGRCEPTPPQSCRTLAVLSIAKSSSMSPGPPV